MKPPLTSSARAEPSAEFVAGRAARLAEHVADNVLTDEDAAVVTGEVKPAAFARRKWPATAAALAALGVTVLRERKAFVVVRCPHCGGRRKAHRGYHVANWLRRGRVPSCGYGTCEPEATA